MPADLTRSETKHAVYETTTCCACSVNTQIRAHVVSKYVVQRHSTLLM